VLVKFLARQDRINPFFSLFLTGNPLNSPNKRKHKKNHVPWFYLVHLKNKNETTYSRQRFWYSLDSLRKRDSRANPPPPSWNGNDRDSGSPWGNLMELFLKFHPGKIPLYLRLLFSPREFPYNAAFSLGQRSNFTTLYLFLVPFGWPLSAFKFQFFRSGTA